MPLVQPINAPAMKIVIGKKLETTINTDVGIVELLYLNK